MGFLRTEWNLQLIDGRTMLPIDDDNGVFQILQENDPSQVTIYRERNDAGVTGALTQPATMANGNIRFWTDATTTVVDICVQTSNGHFFFLESIRPSNQRIVVWPDKMEYTMILPYQVVGASESVRDTGFDILANMLMKDCFLHVTTLGTGATLDIGTSTDPDGFADGVSAATTGYPITLLEEALVSTSSLIGLLLANVTGTDVRKLHRRANGTSGANIVYQNTTSSSLAGEGYIYLTYLRIPT